MKRSAGAQPGHPVSQQTRDKIAKALRGRKTAPEVVAKARGRKWTTEQRANLSALRKWRDGCSVEQCPQKHYAGGFCGTHHRRWKLYGDPLLLADRTGSNNHNWQGANVGYEQAHNRARAALGKPTHCEMEDETCKGRLELSVRHTEVPPSELFDGRRGTRGGPYSLNPDHYWYLCRSHHSRYDRHRPWLVRDAA